MTLKKVSAEEWRKMGLPSSTTTISFISYGGSKKKEKVISQELNKKPTLVLDPITPKKKKITLSGIHSRF